MTVRNERSCNPAALERYLLSTPAFPACTAIPPGDLDMFICFIASPLQLHINDGGFRFHRSLVDFGNYTECRSAVLGDIDADGDIEYAAFHAPVSPPHLPPPRSSHTASVSCPRPYCHA